MKVYCPKCDKRACVIHTRPQWYGPAYKLGPGASLQPQGKDMAVRIRCICGQIIVLLPAEQ